MIVPVSAALRGRELAFKGEVSAAQDVWNVIGAVAFELVQPVVVGDAAVPESAAMTWTA
jgi:hypothetical protein